MTEADRPQSGRRWLISGGIALFFLLLVGYVVTGAAAAGGPVNRADTALATTLNHHNLKVVAGG